MELIVPLPPFALNAIVKGSPKTATYPDRSDSVVTDSDEDVVNRVPERHMPMQEAPFIAVALMLELVV